MKVEKNVFLCSFKMFHAITTYYKKKIYIYILLKWWKITCENYDIIKTGRFILKLKYMC